MKKTFTLLLLLPLLAFRAPLESPKAVIVILSSERNKIAFFERKGDITSADMVRKEVQEIIRVTTNDFTDHFTYCPVYYVMDTNRHYLQDKKFIGILLDRNLTPIQTQPLKTEDFYLIAYFGIPSPTRTKNDEEEYSARTYPGEGIVVMGPDFQRSRRYPAFIYVPENDPTAGKKTPDYNYASKNFNIYYRGWANIFNKKLTNKANRRNYGNNNEAAKRNEAE